MLDYYGLDWALLALGLTTKYLMIYQSRWAFATSILGCLAGLAVAVMAHQNGIAFYNVILISMSLIGFNRWGKLALPAPATTNPTETPKSRFTPFLRPGKAPALAPAKAA